MTFLKQPLMHLQTWQLDRDIVATLADTNYRLRKQLEESYQALKETLTNLLRILLIITVGLVTKIFPKATQVRITCFPRMVPKNGHKRETTKSNNVGGGSQIAKLLKTVVPDPF
jgi:hypothetical protein